MPRRKATKGGKPPVRRRRRKRRRKTGRDREIIRAPLTVAETAETTRPLRNIVIKHREYLIDIEIDTVATTVIRSINPGVEQSFNWLCNIARNFEKYRFRRLSFQYRPQCSATTGGYVLMAIDYDPTDDNSDLTKAEFLSFDGAVRSAPWAPVDCVARALPVSPDGHFVRSPLVSPELSGVSVGDLKMYDIGTLFLQTGSGAAAAVIGELWVDYEIELMIPQTSHDDYLSTRLIFTGGLTDVLPLGSVLSGTVETIPFRTIPIERLSGTRLKINAPGKYIINAQLAGTGITAMAAWSLAGNFGIDAINAAEAYYTAAGTFASVIYHLTVDPRHTTSWYATNLFITLGAVTCTSLAINTITVSAVGQGAF